MIRLKHERKRRGWKLECVSKQVGITISAVCDIEAERTKPSYDTLTKLEDIFGLPHRELFAPAPREDENL